MKLIAGVDEAGRGPLAGPVVAAAVILPKNYSFNELADSKSLKTVKAEWEQAYKLTPHGKPVSLNR